jgi:hypothetical protein
MKLVGAAVVLGVAVSVFSAAPSARDKDHARLTLTGCVVAGEGKDAYLLTNIAVAGEDAGRAPANAFYRLDSTKGLKNQVGHQIELSGTADLSDLDKGTLKVKTDDQGRATAEIKSERKTVTAEVGKDSNLVPTVMAGSEGTLKTEIATYKFKTAKIRVIGDRCQS